MAIIKDTSYRLWAVFKHNHFNTVYRMISPKFSVAYQRKRLFTPDDDFIDLDIASVGSKSVVISVHGLEGSSQSSYILSLAYFLNTKQIDVISVNLRGCSGEDNKRIYAYHSGFTSDLDFIIQEVIKQFNYQDISLVGYSLGGNLVLKYLGEYADKIPDKVKSCVSVSAPCDLEDSSLQLAKKGNVIYMNTFLKTLKIKALKKINRFPDFKLDADKISKAKDFTAFDNYFTAPIFGYQSAEDYWHQNSCLKFIPKINKPTLILSALDDPFFTEKCFPYKEVKSHRYVDLKATQYGGHVGFNSTFNKQHNLWCETQIYNYLKPYLSYSQ